MQQNLSQILQDIGRDAAAPGVELAINLLQELLVDLRGKRAVIDVPAAAPAAARRRGRPPGVKNELLIAAAAKVDNRGVSWSGLTKEERSIEMKRRMAVAAAKRGESVKIKGMHPADPRHPGHDLWIARLKAAQKRYWDAKNKRERKALVEKMQKGKASARAAVDQMRVAS